MSGRRRIPRAEPADRDEDYRDPRQGQRRRQRKANYDNEPVAPPPQKGQGRRGQQDESAPVGKKGKNKQNQQQQQRNPEQGNRNQPQQNQKNQKKQQNDQKQNKKDNNQQQQQNKNERKKQTPQEKKRWTEKGAEGEPDKPKKPRFTKIANARRGRDLFVIAKVEKVNTDATFQPWKQSGKAPITCTEALVGDATGCISLQTRETTLGEVLQANAGNYLCLLNVQYYEGQGVARLEAGQFASFKTIEECADILPRQRREKKEEDETKEGETKEGDGSAATGAEEAEKDTSATPEGEKPVREPRPPIVVDFEVDLENNRDKLPEKPSAEERAKLNVQRKLKEFENKLGKAVSDNRELGDKYITLLQQFEALRQRVAEVYFGEVREPRGGGKGGGIARVIGNFHSFQGPKFDKLTELVCAGKIKQFCLGDSYAALLTVGGEVYTIGVSENGGLGLGEDVRMAETPTKIPQIPKISQIACGSGHTVLLARDGSVYTTGNNGHGQCCLGESTRDTKKIWSPTQVTTLPEETHLIAVAAGWFHTLFLTASGAVFGAGSDWFRQLATDKVPENDRVLYTPVRISNAPPACRRIFAFGDTTFFLNPAGNVYAAGDNRTYALGFKEDSNSQALIIPYFQENNIKIKTLSGSAGGTIFVTVDGKVYRSGTIGEEHPNLDEPTLMDGLDDVVGCGGGGSSYILVKKGGKALYCSKDCKDTPVEVEGVENCVDASCSPSFAGYLCRK